MPGLSLIPVLPAAPASTWQAHGAGWATRGSARHGWRSAALVILVHAVVIWALSHLGPRVAVPDVPPLFAFIVSEMPAARPAAPRTRTRGEQVRRPNQTTALPQERASETQPGPPTGATGAVPPAQSWRNEPEQNPAPAPSTPPRFEAAYLNNPPPRYPPRARKAGEQGRVILQVRVSAEGTALDVRVHSSSGSLRLDQAAIDAVTRWRFEPARQGERAIEATVLVPIRFALN